MNYLADLFKVLKQRFDDNITWNDVSEFERKHGRNLNGDSCRRNAVYLNAFLRGGWKLTPPNEDLDTVELDETQKPAGVEYNSKDNTYTRTKMISIKEGEIITPELIMEKHQIDPEKWEVVTYKNNYWNSQKKGGELLTLFQSKLTVKPKKADELNLDKIKEHFENYIPQYAKSTKVRAYNPGKELLVPCFFDVHFSKLAHADESGEHYDYKIAKKRLIESAKAYIERLEGRSFEKVLLVVGNDYFNSEANAETAHGTRQDNDSRAHKIFTRGTEALIEVINMFAEIAPVDVVHIAGNHDTMTSFYCACVLNAFYRNDSNVNVDNGPKLRKYYRYGTNLIGLTHGSEEKDRIYGLMQVEAAKDWGETTTHEWLIGHLHSEGVTEKNGVTVRRIPSICSADAWHFSQGYTMSPKRSCAFIYNKDIGLTDMLYQGI